MAYINKVVSELDYKWYQEKEMNFLKESFYDQKLKKIKDTIIEHELFEDNGKIIEEKIEIEIDLTLEDYCWDSFYKGGLEDQLSNYNEYHNSFPFNSKHIASKIIDHIERKVEKFTNTKAIDLFIFQTINEIKEEIKLLLNGKENPDYEKVLNSFLQKTIKLISEKFGHIRKQIELLDNAVDKLEFKLSQEKLVALLYLLNRAGVFNTDNFNDRSFLHFCAKYFHFYANGHFKKPKNYTTLTNKYGEMLNDANPNLQDIIQLLQRTIKEIYD